MVTTEVTAEARSQARLAKVGWAVLLAMSALLVLHGVTWFFQGPEVVLTNVAERTNLTPPEFRQGSPSAFDVIALITRNSSVYEVALGLLALLAAWKGYRHGSRWAWNATWILVAAFAALAVDLFVAGGVYAASVSYLSVATVALAGQLLARKGLAQ